MRCTYCNQEMEEGTIVCPACGKEQPAKLEKGRKISRKTWIIAAAIAGAAVIILAVTVFAVKGNPKNAVAGAFKSIIEEISISPMEEVFGWREMRENFCKEPSQIGLKFQLEEASGEKAKETDANEIGITIMNDIKNRKTGMSIGLGNGSGTIANLRMYLDDKKLLAAIPELSSKAFQLKYGDDLKGQMAQSPYFGKVLEESGLEAEQLREYLTECNKALSGQTKPLDIQELWKKYKKGAQALKELKEEMTVKEGEKKSFKIDGKEQECKGYDVIIPAKEANEFLKVLGEFLTDEESAKGGMASYQPSFEELESAMKGITCEDVKLVVYVRKDGKMASFTHHTTIKSPDSEEKLDGSVTFSGGYSMLANLKGTMNIEGAAGEVIELALEKKGTYQAGKDLSGAVTVSMSNGKESYTLSYDGDYKIKEETYSIALDIQKGEEEILVMNSQGSVENLKKGKTVDIVMDSIEVSTGGANGEQEYLTLSGTQKMGPLKEKIEEPQGDTFDVLAATEEEWQAVFYQVVGSLYGISMNLGL